MPENCELRHIGCRAGSNDIPVETFKVPIQVRRSSSAIVNPPDPQPVVDQEESLAVQSSDRQFAFVPRSDLAVEAIDGDLVILDKMQGQIHQLNGTASFIWSAIAAGNTLVTIARKLAEQFDVSQDTAATDIEMVVSKFASLNLLTPDH
jgi:hypothetical protein